MLDKKDFLKYASKLAFPIMIQNLIGTLVNIADTVMLGYVSQTAMSVSQPFGMYNQEEADAAKEYLKLGIWKINETSIGKIS